MNNDTNKRTHIIDTFNVYSHTEYADVDSDNTVQYGGNNYKPKKKYDKHNDTRNDSREYELENNLIPICYEITTNIDLTKEHMKDTTYTVHDNINYPCFSLGFNHWIHATKNKTEVFNTFKNKKKIYQVVNGYEQYIDDYDKSIGIISESYFKLGNKPRILSRAFYKLWEILYYYDLIDINEKKFMSAHLAEGPGSFIQATMFFRELFSKYSKTDKYYAVTLYDEEKMNIKKEFMDYYDNEKPQRVFIHKTYKINDSKTKDNGDITKPNTITNFIQFIDDKVDLVTADGGFEWNNENIQEQESAVLIYGQIVMALNIQKKGGNFVLKIFEIFTHLSIKFIMILKYFYEHVHINKPLTSRNSNSEKYIICIGYKYNNNELIKNMMTILNSINQQKINRLFLHDIFTTIKIPPSLIVDIININTILSNIQFKTINKIIEYINGSNYHGELYTKYKARQIELSEHWINLFMSNNTLQAIKENMTKLIKQYNSDPNLKQLIGYNTIDKTLSRPTNKKTKQQSNKKTKQHSNKKTNKKLK